MVICCLVAAMDRTSTAVAATQQDYDDCSQMSDPARTVAACTRVIADQTQSAADRAGAYLQRGNGHMAGASLDEAIADYGAAIQLDPKNILAYAARAIAFSRKGDRQHAIADYRQAGEIDPAKLAEMAAANGELKELGVLAAAQSSSRFGTAVTTAAVRGVVLAGAGPARRPRARPSHLSERGGVGDRRRHARCAGSSGTGVSCRWNVGVQSGLGRGGRRRQLPFFDTKADHVCLQWAGRM